MNESLPSSDDAAPASAPDPVASQPLASQPLASQPLASQPLAPRPLPPRLLPKLLLAAWVVGAVLTLLFFLAGVATAASFVHLLSAGLIGLFASLAWEIVERRADRGGFLAWTAFPIAWLAGLGMFPFLVLAAYPPIGDFLFAAGRVEARVVYRKADEPSLELIFPHAMHQARGVGNLRLGETQLEGRYLESAAEHFRWIDPQTLAIALGPVERELGLGRIEELTVNGDLGTLHFVYLTGEAVPSQRVAIKRPD